MRIWPSEFVIGKCYYYWIDKKEISFIVLGINESQPWDKPETRRIRALHDGKLKSIICYGWEEFWSMEK